MNFKHVIKPVAAFALLCGAPLLQAQVLGGGAAGGLGGNLGGTLGSGMGSATGSIGGTFDRGDTLGGARGAVDRTRDTGRRVKDRAMNNRETAQTTASSAS